MSEKPVLIVGAGPTGLILAIELARRGVPFHLVERLPEPLGRDRAVAVKSRTLEVFDGLGVADTFLQRGCVLHGIDFFLGVAKVSSVGLDELDTPFPFTLSIPEDETERILTEKLEQLGGRVERGVEFAGLEQAGWSVRARLRSLRDGERMLEASWVVGTDGIHSGVRAAIDDEFEGHDYSSLWGVADARISNWRQPSDRAIVQLEPSVAIAFPLRDGRWRFTFRPDSGDDHLNTIGSRLVAISPGAALEDPDEPQLFHTYARVARRYRSGRVLLAGDAAHACTPFEGHGMNTGIQDAQNLGWKLALVESGAAAEALLDSYEAERRPVAEAVARSGDEAEARAEEGDQAARQALVEFLGTPEGRRVAATAEAEIAFGYERSSIVDEFMSDAEGAGHGTQIGYRVGDAGPLETGGRTFRLHELIAGPGHTLFLLLGEADRAAVIDWVCRANAVVGRYPLYVEGYIVTRNSPAGDGNSARIIHDPKGALHRRLGAERPCLCLVRPDGHLGFRAVPPTPESLEAHLRRIFRSC